MAQEIKMSAAGLKAMQEELEYLKTVRRKELAEEIKEARSHGDLSENSEYDEAKNTQGLVENRITELEQMVKNAVVIDESELSVENVSVGTHVTIQMEGEDEVEEYDIVGRTEADPLNGKISDESPVGHALLEKNPAQGLSESEQVQVRRQKLADLQAAGRDPFTLTKFPQDAYSADLKEEFKDLPNETDSGKKVALAGRLMSKRVMGKASFAHLRDDKGDIQLYVRRDELGEEPYAAFKKLDVGDIIGVKGEVFRTKTGELSARAEEITLLAKSLRPLPEKFHGLTDTEMRYRQRYVDLIANPEVKETFVKRSQILKEIRAYLDEKGFLEVDTPILTPFEIGASARPFYTHHNSLNMDMVLRIETELYLKRLIVGGMDRVYEVGRIFRNEGMDPKHNPEFTSIELYQAFTDFHGMMDLVEELYKRLAQKICGSLVIPYQGKQIDMGHWERLTMIEAVKKYSGVDFNDWKTDEDAIAAAKEHHVELPEVPTKGAILAEFFDAFVEDKLIQPTFIYDYPVEISPLAKRKPDDPAFTERFEYFIDCTEYGNAFSELNDPIDQKGRFERQVAERKAIEPDCKAQVDYDYVNALEYGLPPTGGLGFGVDRLVMLLTDSASIRDVLLFPTMKPVEQ